MNQYNTTKSEELYAQLQSHLLHGVASSFHRAHYEAYPIAMSHGLGSKLYDVDGNEYIDYIQGLGPMILGYAHEALNQAVIEQLALGTHYSTPTRQLLELSEKLTSIIPCSELVSYHNTGTEANLFAFRLARAYTGREKIIKFEGQYHGWADEQKVSIDAPTLEALGHRDSPTKIIHSKGQLSTSADQLIILPWNDLQALEQAILTYKDQIAAVVMEPFMCDSGPILPEEGYLNAVRTLTKDSDILLVFDEVITGFRTALGGAQAYYGVTPDLAVFAKAVAGGFPLAFVCGRKDVMDCGTVASGTFNGNPLSVAAALATIKELEKEDTYPHFDALALKLTTGLRLLGQQHSIPVFTDYVGSICILEFGIDHPMKDLREILASVDVKFYDKVVEKARTKGIRLTPKRGRIYISKAHTLQDIEKTLTIMDEVFTELAGERVH